MLTFAGALAAGAALAAVMLIPFAELLANSTDLRSRAGGDGSLYQPARYLLTIFLPEWWGAGRTALEFASALEEHAYYVAALPLMLGLTARLTSPRPARVTAAAVGAAALMAATNIPPFGLVAQLPGFDASNNGRLAVITVLCLALLAGWGADGLTGRPLAGTRRRALLALAAVLLVAPAVFVAARGYLDPGRLGSALEVSWGFVDPRRELGAGTAEGLAELVRLASLLDWLVVAGAALALLALRLSGRLGAAAFVVLAALLVAGDLLKAGMGYNPAIPVEDARQPTTGAIRFLQQRRPERYAGLQSSRAIALVPPLPPNLGMRYQVPDARGYVVPYEQRYLEYWRRSVATDPDCFYLFCTLSAADSPQALRALGLLGVSLLVENRRDRERAGLPVAYDGADARIYRNPGALPRSFLVTAQRVVPDADAALAAVTAEPFRPRAVAVTEEPIEGLPADTGGAPPGGPGQPPPGRAHISSYERERVVVDAEAPSPALLVLTDNWYPGWKATVDGREAEVHRVDYLLRGVAVPAGRHRVELRFEPATAKAGLAVSGAALLVLAGAVALGLRRRHD